MTCRCRLCGATSSFVDTKLLLGKHSVRYYRCPVCDLLFTEEPHWLEEAYGYAISRLDTGAIERNAISARLVSLVALVLGLAPDATGLDFGAGHGVFVRMARDLGLDFGWYDTHAENLYARGFEGDPSAHHTIVTAFEVVEHFADVSRDLDELFGPRPDFVLVGTVLHDGHAPDWWYFLLESGQHVAFYSRRTMAEIARRYGYDAITGPEYTLFVQSATRIALVRRLALRAIIGRATLALGVAGLVPPVVARRLSPFRSKLTDDHAALKRR